MFGWFSGKGNETGSESIIRDLSSLQINTIIKSHISGGAMPAIRFALCDISSRYASKLTELDPAPSSELLSEIPIGGYSAFDKYQETAKALLEQLKEKDSEETQSLYMLQRIRSNSNRLKLILKGETKESRNELSRTEIADGVHNSLQDLELNREDFTIIRKYWELGTEEIAMQTVIELDGDVALRIDPKYANEDSVSLHDLHHASVNLSYQYWKTIISLVAQFIDTVFGSFFKRK